MRREMVEEDERVLDIGAEDDALNDVTALDKILPSSFYPNLDLV
jgi:hypothetical protein